LAPSPTFDASALFGSAGDLYADSCSQHVSSQRDRLAQHLLFIKHTQAAAAAEFICQEKNMHMYINVKDRQAARKE